MTVTRTKQALIAFGTELVDYQGTAETELRVRLASGEELMVTPNHLQSLCDIAARHNPLLDLPELGVVDWLREHAPVVFGLSLDVDDARRVLGVLGGEGFLPWGGGGHVGHFPAMSLENALDACVGRLGFYGERGLCAPVRILRVQVDDRYLEIEFSVQELSDSDPPSLVDTGKPVVGIKRTAASVNDGCLVASYYINWILVTEPSKVHELTDYFRQRPNVRAMLNEVRRTAGR